MTLFVIFAVLRLVILTKTSHTVILAAEGEKLPTPSSSPAGGDPAAVTVTRTIIFELGNWIAETNR